jgi:hypothetical protein
MRRTLLYEEGHQREKISRVSSHGAAILSNRIGPKEDAQPPERKKLEHHHQQTLKSSQNSGKALKTETRLRL